VDLWSEASHQIPSALLCLRPAPQQSQTLKPSTPQPPQARLAPDLVTLLQHHGQPVDPNLARLAGAWLEAERVLAATGKALPELEGEGGDEDEEEGAGGEPAEVPEDLQVGLV